MKLIKSLSEVLSALKPHQTLDEVIQEQNTSNIVFSRVHSIPRKYIYGKAPDEPLTQYERHPEGQPWPTCESTNNPDIIREHIAICSREAGSKGGLCEMCRKLHNPQRRAFLVRIYSDNRSVDDSGFNVGEATDGSDLNQPATSQYLRQLAVLGLIRRERNGRRVHYLPQLGGESDAIKEIGAMLRERWMKDPKDESFVPIFQVMMGSFRSRVVRTLAAQGERTVGELAELFEKKPAEVIRDLEWAVMGGLLNLTSEDTEGFYQYIVPADPIARRIIELS